MTISASSASSSPQNNSTTSQSEEVNHRESSMDELKSCALTTCGHFCGLCPPVLQQLILLSQKCQKRLHTTIPVHISFLTIQDLAECIKNLLPVVAEHDVGKFKEYVSNEKVEWVKEFILCI